MTLSPTRSALYSDVLSHVTSLDVDAAIMSGRYTRERLLELAAEADNGFDRLLFADSLLTAVLLKGVLEVVVAAKDWGKTRFRRTGA
jgi:hypothetical protein